MTAVAAPTGGVPALYQPPPLEIDGSDVQVPSVKFGHPSSQLCQDAGIKLGTIYSATSKDDPEPAVLRVYQDLATTPTAERDPGLLIHVLGMHKGKSMKVGDDFTTWAFHDPEAHPEADTTYNYQLALPEIDPDMPYKMTLSRSKSSAARTMNTILMRNADKGPAYVFAFRITTTNKEKEGVGRWTVPQARQVEAVPEHVAIAENLAQMVSSRPASAAAPVKTDEPAI